VVETPKRNWIVRCWRFLWSPSARWPFLVLVGAGLIIGLAGSGIFAVAMHYTSTDEFCSSCHTDNVVPEWKQSIHYMNSAGFTAGCGDCHEPRDPIGLVLRKLEAVNEVWGHIRGTISTPEKFEANRLRMAQSEWARLRANGSLECRHCHNVQQMQDPAKSFLPTMHRTAIANGQTCIDCHKGVAHKAPKETAAR
jgi:cytochrome c-type protein NapC